MNVSKSFCRTVSYESQVYVQKGEVAEAQKLYETILQKFSNNIRAQQGLAALNRPVQNNVIQHPPQEVVNQLVNLYNQGQFQKLLRTKIF